MLARGRVLLRAPAAGTKKHYSPLFSYYRVIHNLAGRTEHKVEKVTTDSRTYVLQAVTNNGADGKPLANLSPYLQWHSFMRVPPKRLDQLLETGDCVLCGCCTASCPSYWWNGEQFLGPAALLQAWRWAWEPHNESDHFSTKLAEFGRTTKAVDYCHNIGNCAAVCPKGIKVDRVMNGWRMVAAMQ